MSTKLCVAIIGTVGVPARYGGFETLAEQLLDTDELSFTVVCSSKSYAERPRHYKGAELVYIPLKANGWQSMPYDAWAILSLARRKLDAMLLLGVSGSFVLPLVRLFSRKRIITNIDGIEWKRAKWSPLASWLLRHLEAIAVRYSHVVVTDNRGISDYVRATYGIEPVEIAYGGDNAITHTVKVPENPPSEPFALALSRIEPENNVELILEAYRSELPNDNLIYIGNWESSDFGREMRATYGHLPNIKLLDPIYDQAELLWYRRNCSLYLHGHSAGGTNPSLVEAMHVGKPIAAFDVVFNRCTMQNEGYYFDSPKKLGEIVRAFDPDEAAALGDRIRQIAVREYKWSIIRDRYVRVLKEA